MAADKPLEGSIVIVTGASRGIGCAIAERLGSAGATIVAAARTMEASDDTGCATSTAERIRSRGGKAVAMHVDMQVPETLENLVTETIRQFGRIDILVNNAGTATYLPTDVMPLDTARAQTETYSLGTWHMCHLTIPHMKRQGQGRIFNIGSCVIFPPEPPYADYMATRGYETLYGALKAAIHRFSQGLAAELHADNIAVNVLGPVGAVLTPGLVALDLGLTPDMEICEIVEEMAEAALDIACRPIEYTGQFELSYQFLDRIGRSTLSLDGKDVIVQHGVR
jgi:NAD(P)-dependent dehydrogenase (short-subunit alcohol dehydrogenase family)